MPETAQTEIPFDRIRAVEWEDGRIRLIDQRLLPQRHESVYIEDVDQAITAIRQMVVRGAPAIGVTAAYAVVLAAARSYRQAPEDWIRRVQPELERLRAARPTAVNLGWAVARMHRRMQALEAGTDPVPPLLAEALVLHREDIAANHRMGELGAALIEPDSAVLTHCNAGTLATGGYGTALGVVRAGVGGGRIVRVYADETRPWLQGARLTAWELEQEGIPVTLIADAAAAHLMAQGRVRWVIVGADRIAANGDVANKIGTYGLAVAARHHGVRFMVVAPTSTVDLEAADGGRIPIESRSPEEVLRCGDRVVAPAGARAWNPAFDITPAGLIDAIVTEKGVVQAPDREKMARMMAA